MLSWYKKFPWHQFSPLTSLPLPNEIQDRGIWRGSHQLLSGLPGHSQHQKLLLQPQPVQPHSSTLALFFFREAYDKQTATKTNQPKKPNRKPLAIKNRPCTPEQIETKLFKVWQLKEILYLQQRVKSVQQAGPLRIISALNVSFWLLYPTTWLKRETTLPVNIITQV